MFTYSVIRFHLGHCPNSSRSFFFSSGENQIEKDTKIESETPKTISPHCSVYLMLSWPCFLDKQRNGKSSDQHAGRWFFRRDWHPQFGWTEQVRKLALWAFFLFVHAISLELALFIRPMDRFSFCLSILSTQTDGWCSIRWIRRTLQPFQRGCFDGHERLSRSRGNKYQSSYQNIWYHKEKRNFQVLNIRKNYFK